MEQVELQQHEVSALSEKVKSIVTGLLNNSKNGELSNVHELLLEQIEAPLLKATMESCKFNQVRAAKTLGLSRGTLRKKLIKYFDDKYCGHRGEE